VGFDFWEQVRTGAECAAKTAEGEEVQVQWEGVTAETDVTGQQSLLQNYITQGVNGLVYAATDAKVLADVSKQALDQGLAVVNIETPAPTPSPQMFRSSPRITSPPPRRLHSFWPTSLARRVGRWPLSPSSQGPRPTTPAPRASRT
jgi:hypothetical protein